MNTTILSGTALEKALAAKLEELLRSVDWLRGWQVEQVGSESDAGFDLLATVPLPSGGKAALCVECKGEMRPSVFRMMADRVFSPTGHPQGGCACAGAALGVTTRGGVVRETWLGLV